MRLLTRILLFAGGLYLILLSKAQLRTGHLVFPNASYHQTTFAASGFGAGAHPHPSRPSPPERLSLQTHLYPETQTKVLSAPLVTPPASHLISSKPPQYSESA